MSDAEKIVREVWPKAWCKQHFLWDNSHWYIIWDNPELADPKRVGEASTKQAAWQDAADKIKREKL